jgi:hypothetical protein
MWSIHKTNARKIRNFIFDAGIADTKNIEGVKMCDNIEKDMAVAIRHSVLQTRKTINHADREWKIRGRPAPTGEAITLVNAG